MSLCFIFRGAVDRLFENILIDYSINRVHKIMVPILKNAV